MNQKIRRIVKQMTALLLAAAMLLGECTTGYAAEPEEGVSDPTEAFSQEEPPPPADGMQEGSEPEPTDPTGESPQVLFELEDLRERSVRQYRLSDGTILAAQYGMDVHYETEDGR